MSEAIDPRVASGEVVECGSVVEYSNGSWCFDSPLGPVVVVEDLVPHLRRNVYKTKAEEGRRDPGAERVIVEHLERVLRNVRFVLRSGFETSQKPPLRQLAVFDLHACQKKPTFFLGRDRPKHDLGAVVVGRIYSSSPAPEPECRFDGDVLLAAWTFYSLNPNKRADLVDILRNNPTDVVWPPESDRPALVAELDARGP